MPKFQFLSRCTCVMEVSAPTEKEARKVVAMSMNGDWTTDDVDLEHVELGVVTPDEHEYSFERSFIATVTVSATTEAEARQKLDALEESEWGIGGGMDDTELTCIDDKSVGD